MMRDNPRHWYIFGAAAIPGILLILYLGGFVGQLMVNYEVWMERGGMTGGILMDPINKEPLFCMRYAFSEEGRKGILSVLAVAAALIIYIKLHGKFSKNKDHDDRNFARSKSGTYGTAGWMTPKEMESILEVSAPQKAQGTILGQKDGKLICLPTDTRLNKHLCVFGASGTMKSRAIIRPYLFQSLKRGESVVVTDPKGELYSDTAEMFRRNGYKVRVFNLTNPEHSDSWNCMADLNGDSLMAQVLTNIIISNTSKGKIDHFWDNGEGNLLKSLILQVDQDTILKEGEKHLPAVYRMLTKNSANDLRAIFDKMDSDHPAKAPYTLFAQASDTVRAGIILGLGTRLQVLQNKTIKGITERNDLDLTEPGKTKCAYFVIMSDQESSTEFLSSLFFSSLFIKLARYADSTPNQRCKVPVNVVFDEFNNVGQLDTYPRRLSVVRSRAIQVCHVVQSLAQFKNRYPNEQWAEIIGNCDTQVMLGCTEEQTADYFSSRSGDMTVDVNSTMTVKKTIAVAQMIPQYRESAGVGRRRLLTPDEVFRLPNDEMLIIIRGENILRAKKFDFTGHPYAKKIVKASVYDYYPEDSTRRSQTETENTPDEPGAAKKTAPPQTDTDLSSQESGSGKKQSQSDNPGGRNKKSKRVSTKTEQTDYSELIKSVKQQQTRASVQPTKKQAAEDNQVGHDETYRLDANMFVPVNQGAILSEDHNLHQSADVPAESAPVSNQSGESPDSGIPDEGLAEIAATSVFGAAGGEVYGCSEPPEDY
jgi:type IV secretion system protein VirD4